MAWKLELTTELPQKECKCNKKGWRALAALALLLLGANLLSVNAPPVAPQKPVVASLPGSLEFGSRLLQTESDLKTIEVVNQGSSDLNVRSVDIAGVDASDFRLTDTTCEGTPTPPGQSCTIRMLFHPTAVAQRAAKLMVIDDAGDSPQTVTLTGTGLAPPVVTPATSAWKPVVIHNAGEVPVKIISLFLPLDNNDFNLNPRDCLNKLLAAGENCDVSVRYTPPAELPGSTSCTSELVLREAAENEPHSENGELVAKICADAKDLKTDAVQKRECQYKGITFSGLCIPRKSRRD